MFGRATAKTGRTIGWVGVLPNRRLGRAKLGLAARRRELHGVVITNEGDIVPLQSGGADPRYRNYRSAGHVEGKAAIWIRDNGSSGGVVYHNNTDGTCGYCNSQIGRLLPHKKQLLVMPPADAVATKRRATAYPTPHVGDDTDPKPPKPSNYLW